MASPDLDIDLEVAYMTEGQLNYEAVKDEIVNPFPDPSIPPSCWPLPVFYEPRTGLFTGGWGWSQEICVETCGLQCCDAVGTPRARCVWETPKTTPLERYYLRSHPPRKVPPLIWSFPGFVPQLPWKSC